MATKTFEELKQLAIQIRDEKTNKQNTATRIGTQMLEHIDKLEQDYYDKTKTDEELQARDEKLTELEGKSACLFDVSERFPTGGTDGTDNYTIETAITAVPPELQLYVRYLTFKISDTERELWQFNAIRTSSLSQFSGVDNWYKMRPSMFHEVEWNTNSNVTRQKVPRYERMSGMIIHYTDDNENSIYELYIGSNNVKDGANYP